jgi:hypothetical protein
LPSTPLPSFGLSWTWLVMVLNTTSTFMQWQVHFGFYLISWYPKASVLYTQTEKCLTFLNSYQVPHSQCSLKDNPKFLQNFRSNNNTFKANFLQIFLFIICHCNSGLAFKSKIYYIASQNCMHFNRENFQNLRQKHKWALWMRHQCLSFTK